MVTVETRDCELAKKEGRNQSWVSRRVLFGRFLEFMPSGINSENPVFKRRNAAWLSVPSCTSYSSMCTFRPDGNEPFSSHSMLLLCWPFMRSTLLPILAKKEGKGHSYIAYQLRFGRFLDFSTSGGISEKATLPANLTERRFRSFWERTDKEETNERVRFKAIIEMIEWIRAALAFAGISTLAVLTRCSRAAPAADGKAGERSLEDRAVSGLCYQW